ncbi:MAG TPA: polysaccharide deacetylase family protein [Actinospica sp.]|nr:polysaccharide deacetylase family protein [Actinospica sp.]
MTTYEPWLPPTDPNAQTRALPWSTASEQQDPSERTRIWASVAAERASVGHDHDEEPRGARRSSRRRVLFAAGGLMLLAGGGIATAAAAQHGRGAVRVTGGGSPNQGGVPAGGSSSASRSAAPSSSAPGAPSTSASSSPSAPASSSTSGAPSDSTSGAPSNSAQSGKVYSKPLYYVDDQGPMAIALTLDDGPNPVYTPQVLDILRQYNIKATFNMIGQQVGANLSLVREVSAAGHVITNHTWDHADLSHLSYAQVLSQMDRCNDALANANQTPTIFRAPYGNWSKATFQACAARNLTPVDWSVDTRDWDTSHTDTQDIVRTVLKSTRAHDIILNHDGGGNRRNTVAALKQYIPVLLDRGYNFVAM